MESKGKVRWGVIGTAAIARNQFLPALKKAEGLELVAVASREPAKAEEFARLFGAAKAYGNYEELLEDPTVDAVYIPLPNHLHKEWTVKAAKAGKHVLCEKPLALDESECEEMIQAARDNNVLLMEAFMYRFHPQMKRVKEIIDSGEIGQLKMVRASFTYLLDRPGDIRLRPEYGGGATMDVGCYPIDFSRYIFGREPVEARTWANLAPGGGVDLSLAGVLDFGSGLFSCFDCSFETTNRQFAEIAGTKGVIILERPWRADDYEVSIRVVSEGKEREESFKPANPYRLEIEHFSDCIRAGKEPMTNGESGKQNVRAIRACLKAAKRSAAD